MTDLSIIIVNFNTKDLVLKCLDSIKKFGQTVNLEVIVVDNASTDGSAQSLEQLEMNNRLGNLRIIRNLTNVGYAKANNQGIRISSGEYLLLLNSDTEVRKDALTELMKFALGSSDAGVIGTKLINPDGSLQPSCYHFPTLLNAVREFWLGQIGLFEKYAPIGNKPRQVDAVVGAAFLITPQARQKVGLLNEKYWAYFEDLDYCREVGRKGLRVYYLPPAEILHQHGASFKKLSGRQEQWKKLIPGSKTYHGILAHYLINLVIWSGQKCKSIFG